jgi:hypothetical protein
VGVAARGTGVGVRGVGVGVGDTGDGLGDALGEGLGDGDGLGDRVGDGEGLGLGVSVGVGLGMGLGGGNTIAVGVGTGVALAAILPKPRSGNIRTKTWLHVTTTTAATSTTSRFSTCDFFIRSLLWNRPPSGRFHYWLPEGQVTKYSPQFIAATIVLVLGQEERQPSATVEERSALLHVWVPPLHRHAEEDYVYSMLVWWRLVLGGTPSSTKVLLV